MIALISPLARSANSLALIATESSVGGAVMFPVNHALPPLTRIFTESPSLQLIAIWAGVSSAPPSM